MKAKTWTVITNTGKQAALSLALRRRRFKSRRTSAPESLFIGLGLRAILMTILCDRYLSCKSLLLERELHLLHSKFPLLDNFVVDDHPLEPRQMRG